MQFRAIVGKRILLLRRNRSIFAQLFIVPLIMIILGAYLNNNAGDAVDNTQARQVTNLPATYGDNTVEIFCSSTECPLFQQAKTYLGSQTGVGTNNNETHRKQLNCVYFIDIWALM